MGKFTGVCAVIAALLIGASIVLHGLLNRYEYSKINAGWVMDKATGQVYRHTDRSIIIR